MIHVHVHSETVTSPACLRQKGKIQSETDDIYVQLSTNPHVKASIDEMVSIPGMLRDVVPPLWFRVGPGVAVPVWRGMESFSVDQGGVGIAGVTTL